MEDGARLDVSATGFWGGRHQKAFFMSRSSIQMLQAIADHRFLLCTESFENNKRRKYEQRIREVGIASFTPLVFSTSGDMSGCTNIFYKRLAYLFSLKKKLDNSNVMAWLHCRLSFLLIHSAIACLRRTRSHQGCPANYGALDLALAEGQVRDHANSAHVKSLLFV